MKLKLTKASGHAVHHMLTRCWTPKGRTEMRQHAQLMRGLHAGMFGEPDAATGAQLLKETGELELSGPEALKALADHVEKAMDSAGFPGAMSIGVDELLEALAEAKEPKPAAPAA